MPNRKIVSFLAMLAFFLPSLFGAITTRELFFVATSANVTTDVEVSPSFSSPRTVYCVGDTLDPVTVSSDWYSSLYRTGLKSYAVGTNCLVPDSTVQQNQPINWMTASNYVLLNDSASEFTDVPSFTSFITGKLSGPLQVSIEQSGYRMGTGDVFDGYKAGISMFCTGTVALDSSNNIYDRGPVEYLGTDPSFTPIVLGSAASLTFTPKFQLNGCIASGRTYINPAPECTATTENVNLYKKKTEPAIELNGATVSVSVENPFTCASLPVSAASYFPSPAQPSQQVNIAFNLTNSLSNPARDVQVTSVALAPSSIASGFSSLAVSLASPIIRSGTSKQFTGTVNVPPTEGTYPLRLNITYNPTTPSCNGDTPDCQMTETQIVDVTVGPGFGNLTINCSVQKPVMFPPDSSLVYANCFNSSMQPTSCPSLNWSESFPSASMGLQQTPANGPSVTNTLNAPAPVAQLESGTVSIICADASQCTASCNANLTLSPPPTSMECNFLNHSELFSPNDWAWAQANCTGALGQPAACYRQMWLTNINGGSLSPPITPPNISPQSNFSTNNAPVPQTGAVLAISMNENGGFIIPFITALCNVSVDNVGPNYIIDTISASGDSSIGGTFQVDVRVRNNGNQNAIVDSQTMLLGQNCTGGSDIFRSTPALDAGETSPILEFDCTCSSPGLQSVRAMADATFRIDETNEDDNWASIGFFCQQTFIPQCFDYY
ncbi:MAG: CARDB domain-containing protein [Candidatus Anstonellaceae archaeon]